jgi:hypothetical protein
VLLDLLGYGSQHSTSLLVRSTLQLNDTAADITTGESPGLVPSASSFVQYEYAVSLMNVSGFDFPFTARTHSRRVGVH